MREMYAKILMNGKRMRSSSTNKTAVMLLEINLKQWHMRIGETNAIVPKAAFFLLCST